MIGRKVKDFKPIARPRSIKIIPGFLRSRRIEALIFLALFFGFFGFLAHRMGTTNLLNTIMQTAFHLLKNTVFFIMSITVLSGALAKLCVEFGVLRLLEYILRPIVRVLYGLPGVSALAGIMTFFSDNPAVISITKDKNFSAYFSERELTSLPNFSTAFGMGLIVMTYMTSRGYFSGAVIGMLGAMCGGVVSTRLMQYQTRNLFPKLTPQEKAALRSEGTEEKIAFQSRGKTFDRFLNAILDGGKTGVDLGLSIIPGVLIISTFVMLITFGPADPSVGYQGIAGEGVPILTWIADKLDWFFALIFGFHNPELIAFPVTSLGSVGAALALIPRFLKEGLIGTNEIAVFTAIGMCWSGFISTYTAIFDTLGYRYLTSKALLAQTVGGLVAGICAHLIYLLISLF